MDRELELGVDVLSELCVDDGFPAEAEALESDVWVVFASTAHLMPPKTWARNVSSCAVFRNHSQSLDEGSMRTMNYLPGLIQMSETGIEAAASGTTALHTCAMFLVPS